MITRLSNLDAFEILPTSFTRDMDVAPQLHIYEKTTNDKTSKQILQADVGGDAQNTRYYSFSPLFNNVELGTSNFYPEKALNLSNYHTNSRIDTYLGLGLPVMQYKKCRLLLSRGALNVSTTKGRAIRVYCKMNGFDVTLASISDFVIDTNIVPIDSILFESQLFTEALEFEILDLDYLLNSNDNDLLTFKNKLFGSEIPEKLFIDFSIIDEESEDYFTENGFDFTRLSFKTINQRLLDITLDDSSIISKMKLDASKAFITSELIHQKYDLERYLDTLKNDGEVYEIKHTFLVNMYNSSNDVIGSNGMTLSSFDNIYSPINYRPIVLDDTDHMQVQVEVKIINTTTGMTINRSSTINVVNTAIQFFKTTPTLLLEGATINEVRQNVTKNVTNINPNTETPQIVEVTKKFFVTSQPIPEELVLLPGNFTTKISLEDNGSITSYKNIYLQIGNTLIKNDEAGILTFTIPKSAYNTTESDFYLLDPSGSIITSGIIKKK